MKDSDDWIGAVVWMGVALLLILNLALFLSGNIAAGVVLLIVLALWLIRFVGGGNGR